MTGVIRHIPNILTLFRMAGAAALVFLRPLSPAFFAVYALCGVSDMLDGPIARRLGCISRAGATLDSIADLFLAAALVYVFFPLVEWRVWMLLWAAGVAAVRFASLTVGAVRFRAFLSLHTYLNKLAGTAAFLFPALYALFGVSFAAVFGLCAATLASLEEFMLLLVMPFPDRDIKGAFM